MPFRLGRMKGSFRTIDDWRNQLAYGVFRVRRNGVMPTVRHGGRKGFAVGVFFFVLWGVVLGAVGEDTPGACTDHSKCVFGNCGYRDVIVTRLHNVAAIDCGDPDVVVVGTHDVVSRASETTQAVVRRVRSACPHLRPRAAHCTLAVIKTKEETFLITLATAVLILRYSQIVENAFA